MTYFVLLFLTTMTGVLFKRDNCNVLHTKHTVDHSHEISLVFRHRIGLHVEFIMLRYKLTRAQYTLDRVTQRIHMCTCRTNEGVSPYATNRWTE